MHAVERLQQSCFPFSSPCVQIEHVPSGMCVAPRDKEPSKGSRLKLITCSPKAKTMVRWTKTPSACWSSIARWVFWFWLRVVLLVSFTRQVFLFWLGAIQMFHQRGVLVLTRCNPDVSSERCSGFDWVQSRCLVSSDRCSCFDWV